MMESRGAVAEAGGAGGAASRGHSTGEDPGVVPPSSLPVVDLSLPPHDCARVLAEACRGPGFFYLVNHGVPAELLASVFRETEALFALGPQEKHRLNQDSNGRGYTGMGEQKLDPLRQPERGDTKEGYYIGVETPVDDPRAQLPLHGPNVWPDPSVLPEFRPIMEEYFQACRDVSMRVIDLMALALGLPGDFFRQPGKFDHAVAKLRLVHYAREASSPEGGVFGCGAHSDWGMLTLLATGGPGLQICRDGQRVPQAWEAVGEVGGAFVVNLGDMLERWTNGHWRSTLHRVIIPAHAPKDRYSVPFFFEPNFEFQVQALPCCTGPDDPPRWPPTTAGEHLLEKYRQTHMQLDQSLKS